MDRHQNSGQNDNTETASIPLELWQILGRDTNESKLYSRRN